jgi:hypothetical protein
LRRFPDSEKWRAVVIKGRHGLADVHGTRLAGGAGGGM